LSNYIIDKQFCRLKEELTLDEAEQAQLLLDKITPADKKTLTGKFSNEDIKKLLSIICEPLNDGVQINYGNCKETTSVEVVRDFFLKRIKSTITMQASLVNSTQDQLKQMQI
jgi:hypothetical protein